MPKPPSDPSSSPETPKIRPDKIPEKGSPTPPDTSTYKAYKEEALPATAPKETSQLSPMDLASKAGISTTPTFDTLLAQSTNAKDTLGDVEKNLKTPNMKFKKSQEELLKNKLNNANEHLKTANQKMGANIPEETKIAPQEGPVNNFLGLVTDGQNKLSEAHNQLQNLKVGNKTLAPEEMLLIQIKLAQAQQEIEYSSVLLSKVVDSLKQIISIQM